jgi:hypothetical protein
MVNGEVAPFGLIVYAFGEETNHHSTTHHSPLTTHHSPKWSTDYADYTDF